MLVDGRANEPTGPDVDRVGWRSMQPKRPFLHTDLQAIRHPMDKPQGLFANGARACPPEVEPRCSARRGAVGGQATLSHSLESRATKHGGCYREVPLRREESATGLFILPER